MGKRTVIPKNAIFKLAQFWETSRLFLASQKPATAEVMKKSPILSIIFLTFGLYADNVRSHEQAFLNSLTTVWRYYRQHSDVV